MFDIVVHRLLRIPYILNVHYIQRPQGAKKTVLFIHGIGSSGDEWSKVIDGLPDNIQIITIDLLGFGDSPKPKWPIYNAKTQTNALLATLLKLAVHNRLIIVGHSLGALVAVEVAKRYPLLVESMVLCSPPFYNINNKSKRFLPSNNHALRKIYMLAKNKPDRFLQLSAFAMKYNLVNESFNVTNDNVDSFMAALEAMIINQTSYDDALNLKVPTTVIRGALDPLVIGKNIRAIERFNPNVRSRVIIASHEVRGLFVVAVVNAIKHELQSANKRVI
ncbi:MAG: alpha/beta hydrolase [Candidatus Saccharimonadales bacterium]